MSKRNIKLAIAPLLYCIGITVFYIIYYTFAIRAIVNVFFEGIQADLLGVIIGTLSLALVFSAFHLWGRAGFNSLKYMKVPLHLWIPVVLVIVLPFLNGIDRSGDFVLVAHVIFAMFLTSFLQEGLFRGVIMHILKPLGLMWQIIIASLLLASTAAYYFRFFVPSDVVILIIGTFMLGIGLGAIRIKTNTIWVAILLHTFQLVSLRYSSLPFEPLYLIQTGLFMLYGIFLMRYTVVTKITK